MSNSSFNPSTLRRHILHMAHSGGSVHVGCAFSVVEIFSTLYQEVARYNPKNADDPARDYILLSKGHGVMAQYACLRELGWVGQSDLDNYFKDGSRLHGLAEYSIPGLEISSGSLGHGLPVAAGIALGLKLKEEPRRVFCVVGDGEMNEGSMWEALLFAQHHQLNNLIVIVDANGFQAMGKTETVLGLEPVLDKFKAFGFETRECDGHDQERISLLLKELLEDSENLKPKALIARTVKGKGVSFMEGNNQWHYLRLNDETYYKALKELE